jgi:hypothetical protein
MELWFDEISGEFNMGSVFDEQLISDSWKAIPISEEKLDLYSLYDKSKDKKRYSSGPIKTPLDEELLDKYNDRLENEPRNWRKFIKSLTHQVTPEEITRLKQLRRQEQQKKYNQELRKRKKKEKK